MNAVIERKPLSVDQSYDEPLFNNTHQALVFAFNYTNNSPLPSVIGKMYYPPSKEGKGLVGVDGAAQAGFIRARIERLPRIQRDIIVARFANTATHACPCCHQETASDEWREAISNLARHDDLRELPRAVQLMCVQKAMNLRKAETKAIAMQFGMSERMLQRKNQKLRDELCKIEGRALGELDGFFSAVGLTPKQ